MGQSGRVGMVPKSSEIVLVERPKPARVLDCQNGHPMITVEGREIVVRCPLWRCFQAKKFDLLELVIHQVTNGAISGDEVVAAMESLRETGLIDLRSLEERQKQQEAAEESRRLREAEAAEAKRQKALQAAEEKRLREVEEAKEAVWFETIRKEIDDETNVFLKGIGRSSTVPEIPFCREQVERYRQYAKEVLGYDGQVLWWIPNGLRFEEVLEKHPALKNIEDPIWQQNAFDDDIIMGRWVLWAPRFLPNSKKGVGLKAEALDDLDTDVATYEGSFPEVLTDAETVYLTLVAAARGQAFPDENEWILTVNVYNDESDLSDEDNWGTDLACTAFRLIGKGAGRMLEIKMVGAKLKGSLGIAPAIVCEGDDDND